MGGFGTLGSDMAFGHACVGVGCVVRRKEAAAMHHSMCDYDYDAINRH